MNKMNKNTVNIGIIGFGTVGAGTAKILLKKQKDFEKKLGFPVVLKRIADLDIKRDRGVRLKKGVLVNDANAVLNDPDIDIVVELIGGTKKAKEITLQAIKNGKHVVTANKALLAESGTQIFKAAGSNRVYIVF